MLVSSPKESSSSAFRTLTRKQVMLILLFRDIETNKQYTIAQMNMVHDTLDRFELDFINKLNNLGDNLKDQINTEGQFVRAQWQANHERMDDLEALINKEREDRIRYHDDNLNPIRAQVKSIQDGLVKEKKDRVAGEKKVLKQIHDESTNMQNDIRRESIMRQEKMGDLDDFLTQDTTMTTKFLEKFEAQATQEATKFMEDLEQEMNSRFAHQNKILDNMSRFVGKFQSTLKIFGKDV